MENAQMKLGNIKSLKKKQYEQKLSLKPSFKPVERMRSTAFRFRVARQVNTSPRKVKLTLGLKEPTEEDQKSAQKKSLAVSCEDNNHFCINDPK